VLIFLIQVSLSGDKMKTKILALACSLFAVNIAQAQNFPTPKPTPKPQPIYGAVYGSLGSDKSNASGAIGVRGKNWGVELGMLFDGEYYDVEVLDYPVPHTNFNYLGVKNVDGTFGLDVLRFENFDNTTASIYYGAGLYVKDEALLAQSNATGWIYREEDKPKVLGAASIGFQWPVANRYSLGVGYHTIRGINASFGVAY
jgi:hypothetical protein